MAISDRAAQLNGQGTPAPAAPAPAAPAVAPAAPAVSGSGTSSGKVSDAFKQKGAAIRAGMTADQKAVEGSKQDKVAYVAPIGDPTRTQSRTEKGQSKPSFVVVGHRVRVLEDMMIPVSHLKAEATDAMDTEGMSEVPAKAGDIVDLNLVEMVLLISRPEFAGKFTGEGQACFLSCTVSDKATKVRPVIKLQGTSGSIKTNMVLIADIVGKDKDPNGKGTAVIKEEFKDKFGALLRRKSAKKVGGGLASPAGETAANLAAAFQSLYKAQLTGQGN